MGPDLAKRHGLGRDNDASPAKKTAAQSDHKMSRKEVLANDSETAREIETLILQKAATKAIPLARLVRELSDELPYKSDKVISKIVELQTDKNILMRESGP